ncbi:DUF3899 domain-containing protein [Halobacillus sp. K22]|uniref:DUF3899 domain-containing protein n=1 Tax=Halobacillus sp. K22 TaxID=3457431 RepID=UPI003FCCCD41
MTEEYKDVIDELHMDIIWFLYSNGKTLRKRYNSLCDIQLKVSIVTLVLSFFAWFLNFWGMGLEEAEVINHAFYWGLILLTIGASFYIGQTGFLHLFSADLRDFLNLLSPFESSKACRRENSNRFRMERLEGRVA